MVPTHNFLNLFFTNPASKHLLGFAQTQYSAQECAFSSVKRFEMQHFQCNALFLRTRKRTARGTYPQWIFQAQPYSAQGSAYYAELRSHSMQKCTPNQRNKNNLKDSHLIRTTDAQKSLSASKSTATLCGG